jgi:hypothetical protein
MKRGWGAEARRLGGGWCARTGRRRGKRLGDSTTRHRAKACGHVGDTLTGWGGVWCGRGGTVGRSTMRRTMDPRAKLVEKLKWCTTKTMHKYFMSYMVNINQFTNEICIYHVYQSSSTWRRPWVGQQRGSTAPEQRFGDAVGRRVARRPASEEARRTWPTSRKSNNTALIFFNFRWLLDTIKN